MSSPAGNPTVQNTTSGTGGTGEVANLTNAIQFAADFRLAALAAFDDIEIHTGALMSAGVSGRPLQLLATAAEQLEQLEQVCADLVTELQRHTTVAEAYQSVGDDAGEKQFNQLT